MAIYKSNIVNINLEAGSIFRSFLNNSIGYKDDDADRFGVRVFRDGEPVDLSGLSCQAVFMAPNGVKIALTSYGHVSGNEAYVTLPPACYDYEGQFCLAIKLVGGGVTSTVRIVDGMVENTGASGAVTPTSAVPTYQEILATYDAMVAATSAANLAIAEEFDASEAYPAGKNVINDGALYILPNGHTAGTTWANTTKVASNLGDQVTDLKSALNYDNEITAEYVIGEKNYFTSAIQITKGSYIADDGTVTTLAGFWYTDLIPIKNGTYRIVVNADAGTGNSVWLHGYKANETWDSLIKKWTGVTSPGVDEVVTINDDDIKYVRVSSYQTKHLVYLGDALEPIADSISVVDNLKTLSTQYIKFNSISSLYGRADSIDGLIRAEVTNSAYDIALYYLTSGGTETNTGWLKSVDLTEYRSPQRISIRKSDSSTIPAGSADNVVLGFYMSHLSPNSNIYKINDAVYVDGTDGSDLNNGYSRFTAFKTIQKAIDSGYKRILVRPGTYTSGISLVKKNGVEINVDPYYSTWDASTANTNPKVIIDCDDTLNYGISAQYCSDCIFTDIVVIGAKVRGVNIERCTDIVMNNCIVHDCSTASGYVFSYSNGNLYNCGAYNIGTYGGSEHRDGFAITGTGTVNFFNCWANYCEDDGISHHYANEGIIDGGEWHHCGKGGVASPTHGAKIDVRNVYCHDCAYGIYAGNDTEALAKTFTLTNCVCKDNTTDDIYVKNNTANIWNCIYSTIRHDGTGTNNVLSGT